MLDAYITHLLILIAIYVILTVSLNLTLGYTGLLNLGHVAFFGVGAYASALLVKEAGWPFLAAFIVAGLVASVFGFILYYVTKKLKGDYLALATLGFSFVIHSVLLNWTSLTRGPLGIPGIPKPTIFGYTISSNVEYLIFTLVIAAISTLLIWLLVRSPFGRLLEASRDDPIGLRVLGKNVYLMQYKAMMISAFFAGIAGSVFAHFISFIEPNTFALQGLILVITIVIVGGLASIKGSVVAPIVLILIPELLRFVSLPNAVLGPARQILYALILLAILIYRPRGLFGRVDLQ